MKSAGVRTYFYNSCLLDQILLPGVINDTIQSLHKGKVHVGLEDMAEIIRVLKGRFTFLI